VIPNFTHNTNLNTPQHLITAWFKPIGLNILKCICGSRCSTEGNPSHSRHIPQIFQEIQHSKNKCLTDSSSAPHKGHRSLIKGMSRLERLSLVGMTLHTTLQDINCAEGNVFRVQKFTNKSSPTTDVSPMRHLYAAFTEKSMLSTSFQSHLSGLTPPSLVNLLLSNNCNRTSTRLDSHTKRFLLHRSFHDQILLFQTPTCERVQSVSKEIEKSLGNLCSRRMFSNHLSSQNLISFPSPTSHRPLPSKSLPHPSKYHTFLRSLHHIDSLQI